MMKLKPTGKRFGCVVLAVAGICAVASPGCASSDKKAPTSQPSSARERQDAALRDPFNYKPDMNSRDVSGGDIGHLDRDGMKRDLNNVFNP